MINNVVLMGRLTAAPELKTTTSGKSVTSFTVAVDRSYTPKGEEKKADFINCVAWQQKADFITKWFKKGDMIAITGEIQTRKYTDKNGNNRTAFEIIVADASFCGFKSEKKQETDDNENIETIADNTEDFDDSDLPF